MNAMDYWEIPSTDIEKSAKFYSELFGWKMEKSGDKYYMFSVEGGLSGGIQQVEEPPGHGIAVYVQVEDVPATLKRVEELGGTILHSKTEIGGDRGFWADFKDPGGCRSVGLWSKT